MPCIGTPPSLYLLRWGPHVGARRSFCRGPAICLSGSGALCVGPRRSLCRAPALLASGPAAPFCRGPVLSFESRRRGGPKAPLWRSVCRAPPLSVGVCVGARRSVSGPGAPSLCGGPALCVGARRSFVSGPGAVGAGALCVGPRRSLCRGPALFLSRVFLYRRSALFSAPLCRGAALRRSLRVGTRRLCQRVCRGPGLPGGVGDWVAVSMSGSCALQLRSACHPSGPAGPQLPSACHPSSPARSLFPGENPKPYCLGENICKRLCFPLLAKKTSFLTFEP